MVSKRARVPSYTVHYRFTQRFDFPARAVYDWSMDYRTDDIKRLGKVGSREIERINDDTLVLTDSFDQPDGSRVVKRRLIRMYPELLTMVNTRLSEDGLHSQFLYQFVDEEGGRSRLDFTGSQVFYGRRPSSSKIAETARALTEEDSQIWVNLNKALETDLGPKRKG